MALRFRPLPLLTAACLAALVLLIALGNWQWGRYREKLTRAKTKPSEVTLVLGRPDPSGLSLVFAPTEAGPGWRVFVPVATDEGRLYVDADWIPGVKTPDWRTVRLPPTLREGAEVTGLQAPSAKPGWLAPAGDPLTRAFYVADVQAMTKAAGLGGVQPFYVGLPRPGPGGALAPDPFIAEAGHEALPPERHLGYAVTWWGLAAALVAIYFAFHARQGRFAIAR